MQLYTNPMSPFCRAASIHLDEQGVAHERVELVTGADRARLEAVSPRRMVPVLVAEGGSALEGYEAIADHLEAGHAAGSVAERARATRIGALLHRRADPLQFLLHLVAFRRRELGKAQPTLLPRIHDEIGRLYRELDGALAESQHLAGATFSRSDILGFTLVSSLVSMGAPLPAARSRLEAWYRGTAARPAVARDAARTVASERAQAESPDPFFRADRVHWRDHRIEWACRLGLTSWLADEIRAGRAFFSPPPILGNAIDEAGAS